MASKQVIRTAIGSANDATDLNQVGSVYFDGSNGKSYRYVQVEDADLAVNEVVEFANATGTEVTNDVSGGSSIGNQFAGVALNTVTDAYYTWVQVEGLATCAVAANTAVVAGARVVTGSADGVVETATTATMEHSFGMALANDTATTSVAGTVAVMID